LKVQINPPLALEEYFRRREKKLIFPVRWPYFHNGVAAGLRLSAMSSEDIDSSWIMFNKQNAGDSRDKVNYSIKTIHDKLCQCHSPTV
jgi:hypothetical protein